MNVMVAYASKHGSTKGIADFIGERLRNHGLGVDFRDVKNLRNPEDYEAFVVGIAICMFQWMKEAREFVSRNRAILSNQKSEALWF